jgi:GAF domain
MAGESLVQIDDCREDTNPILNGILAADGARTMLFIPLRKEQRFVGFISVCRQEVKAFSDRHISLLKSFAAHAVIAMENARLLNEQREALEQQTLTAEVLQVINASPGDLAPVFDAMLGSATRLCEAPCGLLSTYDGEFFRYVAVRGEAKRSNLDAVPWHHPPASLGHALWQARARFT